MPLKRRVSKNRRLDDYRRQQLLEGPDACLLAAMGYLAAPRVARFDQLNAEQQAEVLATMRADWALFGPDLMEWWRASDQTRPFSSKPWICPIPGSPDRLPWAAEQFGETPDT